MPMHAIAETAQQRLVGMSVCIEEARDRNHVLAVLYFGIRVAGTYGCIIVDRYDAFAVDHRLRRQLPLGPEQRIQPVANGPASRHCRGWQGRAIAVPPR